MQPSIIIADDHPLILKGLREFLLERDYAIEACASDGKSALNFIESIKPDIAILDIQMPHYTGIQIAKICKERQYATKIIVITFEKDEKLYNEAKALNIFGYVLKEFALTEIENCIASVINGKPYFSPELISSLESKNPPSELNKLTPTEKKVLKLISENKTAAEIGLAFSISSRTVEKHKSNIIKKLGLSHKQNSLLVWTKENQEFL
ncbi:response regulator [Winogradskyella sp. 3972H.M.0a.05]|uniref:response regulator n=1 Tax=Winogradskyella sp. 3972H.M.0a.05 TaxID=2950277 RepID=UPI0033939FE7